MKYTFNVEGMMCEKCSGRLTAVLSGLDGVENAEVSLEKKTAAVTAAEGMEESIRTAIEDAGFEVV